MGAILRDPLPNTTEDLKASLIALECLRTELLTVRVDTQQLLMEKRAQYLLPKDKDWTELDRKTRLNAQLANIERDAEFLEGLEKLTEQRLELGMTLLKIM